MLVDWNPIEQISTWEWIIAWDDKNDRPRSVRMDEEGIFYDVYD